MAELIIDRIENHRFDRRIKLIMWLAISSVLLVIGYLLLSTEGFNKRAEALDFMTFLGPAILFLYSSYTTRKWGGQFIKWEKDHIEYKARETHRIIVQLNEIESISINLDTIDFLLKDGNKKSLLIEDYTEYEDRIRIKQNFEKIKLN